MGREPLARKCRAFRSLTPFLSVAISVSVSIAASPKIFKALPQQKPLHLGERAYSANKLNFMRSILSVVAVLPVVALLTSGCINAQEKLGRGFRNAAEPVRLSDFRTSVEQTTVWQSPSEGATTGVVKGVCLSATRTGVGLYEILTFPFPPYHPVLTKYLSPLPPSPSNYRPSLPNDPLFQTDQYIGFSGGNNFGWVPGSQFNVFGY
jgi:putative exosortase-associated protein (TIGR04073 family)